MGKALNGGGGQGGATFDDTLNRVVAWVEDRLKRGGNANPDWHNDIVAWAEHDPDGDDDAPPILIGELMTRLGDPTYGGNPPGTFNHKGPPNSQGGVNHAQTVRLSWDKSSNVYYYDVVVSEDPTFTGAAAFKDNAISNQIDIPANTLSAGKTYYWRITAKNGKGAVIAAQAPWSFSTG